MDNQKYNDDAYWRQHYLNLFYELGEIINEQQDKIVKLASDNKRLKAENWQLKHRKRK